MKKAFVGGIEAVAVLVAGVAAGVIGGIAVEKAVRQHELEDIIPNRTVDGVGPCKTA